jgi:hypothetical protein
MNRRGLILPVLGLLLILAQCASPPVNPAPSLGEPTPPRPPVPPPEIDDDHRLVSREQFLEGSWKPLPPVTSWNKVGNGVVLTLKDGRTASVAFLTSRSVRLWFPQTLEAEPASPLPRTWPTARLDVSAKETETQLILTSKDLELSLDKTSLAWQIRQGQLLLFQTPSGPSLWKKRLKQEFSMAAQPLWTGLGSAGTGLDKAGQWVRLWTTSGEEGSGPWGVPFVLASGAPSPFGFLVDNSYQSYVNLTATPFVGTLNGGLDLIFWTERTVAEVVGQMTAVTGRLGRTPASGATTGFVLPPGNNGEFLRRARLSVGRALLGEATEGQVKALEAAHFTVLEPLRPVPGRGIALPATFAPAGWDKVYPEGGKNFLLARANNLFPAWLAQSTWEAQRAALPTARPWITWQSGFVGSARWGAPELVAVAGADDQGLLDRLLSVGLSGFGSAQVKLDITGLADPEHSAATWRGLQLAVMNPYLVLDAGQDPATWWSNLPDKDKKLFKSMLDRRSSLKPTMVEILRQSAQTGVPAIRPLFWAYPNDVKARAIRDEYLLGDSILVAPAVNDSPTRKVYLPGGGLWFEFPDGDEFSGGESYDMTNRPDFPVLFVRAGSFIPVREPEIFDEKATYSPFLFHVYPGGFGSGYYSVDDGFSHDDERGLITTVKFNYGYSGGQMVIQSELEAAGPRMRYSDPYLLLRIHKVYNPKIVKIDGKGITKYGDSFGVTETDRSAAWYENDNSLLIKLFNPDKPQTITLEFARSP